jgi:hypothetical protein
MGQLLVQPVPLLAIEGVFFIQERIEVRQIPGEEKGKRSTHEPVVGGRGGGDSGGKRGKGGGGERGDIGERREERRLTHNLS